MVSLRRQPLRYRVTFDLELIPGEKVEGDACHIELHPVSHDVIKRLTDQFRGQAVTVVIQQTRMDVGYG